MSQKEQRKIKNIEYIKHKKDQNIIGTRLFCPMFIFNLFIRFIVNNSIIRKNVVQWHAFSLLNQPYGVQILFLKNILYITSPIYK